MVGAFFASLALMLFVLVPGFMHGIFKLTDMTGSEWLVVAGLSLVPMIVMELGKEIHALLRRK